VFPVKYGLIYRVELSFKYKTGRWIMSRNVIVTLIYRLHKPKVPDVYCRGPGFSNDKNTIHFIFQRIEI
jgi:hypothetical protein